MTDCRIARHPAPKITASTIYGDAVEGPRGRHAGPQMVGVPVSQTRLDDGPWPDKDATPAAFNGGDLAWISHPRPAVAGPTAMAFLDDDEAPRRNPVH